MEARQGQLKLGLFYRLVGVVAVLVFAAAAVLVAVRAPAVGGGGGGSDVLVASLRVSAGMVCALSLGGIVVILRVGRRRR